MNHWVEFQRSDFANEKEISEVIRKLWREYMIDILGIPESSAVPRIEAEVRGDFHVDLLNSLESQGWQLKRAIVLDIGCGTGALASALIARGAHVIGIEPSFPWGYAAHHRLVKKKKDYGQIIIGNGAYVPLKDQSVDYVFSLQVLEHVPQEAANKIIREIARVLRPGGRAYITFESYLSFWEPHYKVRWFPYLPKKIGSAYLQLLGRDSAFLWDHIHYNSMLTLMKTCFEVGLYQSSWKIMMAKLNNPTVVNNIFRRQILRMIKFLPPSLQTFLVWAYLGRGQLFHTTITLRLTRE